MKEIDKNIITMVGQIKEIKRTFLNHDSEYFETNFYVKRKTKSGEVDDEFIVIMKKDLYDIIDDPNKMVKVTGELRTYSHVDVDGVKHLKVSVFVKSLELTNEDYFCQVLLNGTICKINELRFTPKGRKIRDFCLASDYSIYKTAYIPSICWEKVAEEFEKIDIGTKIISKGVLHSRKYIKTINDQKEERTAYEYCMNEYCIFKGNEDV